MKPKKPLQIMKTSKPPGIVEHSTTSVPTKRKRSGQVGEKTAIFKLDHRHPIVADPNIRNEGLIGKTLTATTKPKKSLKGLLTHLTREYDKIQQEQNLCTKYRKQSSQPPRLVAPEHSNGSKLKNSDAVQKIHNVQTKLNDILKKHNMEVKPIGGNCEAPVQSASMDLDNLNHQIFNVKFHVPTKPAISTTALKNELRIASSVAKIASKTKARKAVTRYNVSAINDVDAKAIATKEYTVSQPFQLRDEMKHLRDKVNQAIKCRRTFTVCGHYYSIRHALLSRGWVEKLHINYIPHGIDASLYRRLQTLTIPELSNGVKDKELGSVYRNIIISKLIGTTQVAFYWDLNRETYRQNAENLKDTLINFISKNRFNYANKQGLCECAKSAYWFHNPGVSYLLTPRSYCLTNAGDPEEFIEDFKVTAAMSFLKWILYIHENKASKLISASGKVPLPYFHFALRQCANFIRKLRHEDIDTEIISSSSQEWQTFLDYFYKAVHVGNHFKQSGLESELSLVHKSRTMLKKIMEHLPDIDMDGFMNIWILKPAYGSRGMGIHFCRTLQYVLKVVKENKNNSYVIQKYIERPLLIYNTKFDIRQWFLISSTQPITIWLYKECYLRFSSQTYNLRKLHESIHLTNNSVQSKYHNGNRDLCLPSNNMWFLSDFKKYLDTIGYPQAFEQIIQPGMKECIVAAILSNQDSIYRTSKAFELHGADFMLTEDFRPWLIEINSKPALNPSTSVTSKLCPMVLEDVIKVVVDNSRNQHASTGNFELIYKEKLGQSGSKEVQNFHLEGKPLKMNYFLTAEDLKSSLSVQSVNSIDSLNVITTADYMKYVGNEMKKTLRQLLQIVEKERHRRRTWKNKEPKQGADDTFTYCRDIQKIQSNMEEIEEIFNQKFPNSESAVSVNLARKSNGHCGRKFTSDISLKSQSKIISNVLTNLNKSTNSRTLGSAIKVVSGVGIPCRSECNANVESKAPNTAS